MKMDVLQVFLVYFRDVIHTGTGLYICQLTCTCRLQNIWTDKNVGIKACHFEDVAIDST